MTTYTHVESPNASYRDPDAVNRITKEYYDHLKAVSPEKVYALRRVNRSGNYLYTSYHLR